MEEKMISNPMVHTVTVEKTTAQGREGLGDSASTSLWSMIWFYSNPLKCGKKNEMEKWKDSRKDVILVLLPLTALLRAVNTVLWILLITLYFYQVDGSFSEIKCPDHVVYCSNTYVLSDECVNTGNTCRVSSTSTLIIVFLTISQFVVFTVKDRGTTFDHPFKTIEYDDLVESPLTLSFAFFGVMGYFYLFLLFVMEAMALPFGTKEGKIAFVMMDEHHIGITVLVYLIVFGYGIILSGIAVLCFYEDTESETACCWRLCTVGTFGMPYVLILAALFIHIMVVVVWSMVSNHEFYSASMFYMSIKSEYLLYKSIRTFFSILSVLEAVCMYFLLRVDNGDRLWYSARNYYRHDKMHAKRCLYSIRYLDWASFIPAPDGDQND